MTSIDILTLRLHNEQLTQKMFTKPTDVVKWLGAIQSQDFAGAKWAIGLRVSDSTDQTIQKEFNEGKILRTHIMRPTWHFVSRFDIRWMLTLTAPQVKKLMGHYNRLLELTPEVFVKSQTIITKALEGGKALTRQELKLLLNQEGILTNIQRLAHIVMEAELDALLCSGPLKGKQFTYMLLDERVPKTETVSGDEALQELTKRYFQSHGPATVNDFSWWSGLTAADCKKGITHLAPSLQKEIIEGREFYFYPSKIEKPLPKVFLLPNYDEYTIAYKERFMFLPEDVTHGLDSRENAIFQNAIIHAGKIIGFWRRTLKKNQVIIEPKFFTKPSNKIYESYKKAAETYGKFFGLEVECR